MVNQLFWNVEKGIFIVCYGPTTKLYLKGFAIGTNGKTLIIKWFITISVRTQSLYNWNRNLTQTVLRNRANGEIQRYKTNISTFYKRLFRLSNYLQRSKKSISNFQDMLQSSLFQYFLVFLSFYFLGLVLYRPPWTNRNKRSNNYKQVLSILLTIS